MRRFLKYSVWLTMLRLNDRVVIIRSEYFLCFLWVFKRWQITHKLYIKRFGLYSVWDLPGFTYRLNPQIYIIYSYNYKITEELAFKSDIHVFSYYILLPISILFPQYKEGELHFRRFVCDHSIRLHRVS